MKAILYLGQKAHHGAGPEAQVLSCADWTSARPRPLGRGPGCSRSRMGCTGPTGCTSSTWGLHVGAAGDRAQRPSREAQGAGPGPHGGAQAMGWPAQRRHRWPLPGARFQLQRSGLGHRAHWWRSPARCTTSAATNTQVVHGFLAVKGTEDIKESAAHLALLMRGLQGLYQGHALCSCPRRIPGDPESGTTGPSLLTPHPQCGSYQKQGPVCAGGVAQQLKCQEWVGKRQQPRQMGPARPPASRPPMTSVPPPRNRRRRGSPSREGACTEIGTSFLTRISGAIVINICL